MSSDNAPLPALIPVYWATSTALGELEGLTKRDRAAEALARRYARDIDDADVISTAAGKVLRELGRQVDVELYDKVSALFDRIEATAVLALLGPKLLAVLSELGMTPRARAEVTRRGGAGGVGGNAPESEFQRLRRERMARQSAT